LRLPITGRLPPLRGENRKSDANELNCEGMQNGCTSKQGSAGDRGVRPNRARDTVVCRIARYVQASTFVLGWSVVYSQMLRKSE